MFRFAAFASSKGLARRVLSSAVDVPAACFLPAEEVASRVVTVASSFKSAPQDITPSSSFGADLGFDSLLIKDLVVRLGEEFCVEVPSETAHSFYGLGDAIKYFSSHPKAR